MSIIFDIINMNGKITKKSYNKRKYRNKKNKGVFRRQTIMRVGFPKTTCIKLRYVDAIQLNATPGVIDSWGFRANGCFDPDQTGAGHQPSGFDQWSQFYNHYIVVGSKIKCTYGTTSVTTTGGLSIRGIFLSDDTTFSSLVTDLLEQSQNNRSISLPSATDPTTTSKTYSAKKYFNITNITDNWSRLGALVTTNPQEQCYFYVYYGNINNTIDPIPLTVLVEIEYIVIFSEPKELPQS